MRYLFFLTAFFALLALTNSFSIAAEEAKKENEKTTKSEAAPNFPASKPELEVINLTVYPAPLPRPMLKYRLLPTYLEMKPGNAAPLYYRFFFGMKRIDMGNPDMQITIDGWLNTPIQELPQQEVNKMLQIYSNKEIEYATYRMECDWDLPFRESNSPYDIILEDMQTCREYGRVIALKARMQIAQRNPIEALRYLQMGYALSGHVAKVPCLVCTAIGNAIANMMNDQLLDLCQGKNAPNLYWTLTILPRPFIDFHKAIDYESVSVSMQFKELLSARTESHSVEQWQDLWISFIEKYNDYVEMIQGSQGLSPNKNKFTIIEPRKVLKERYAFVCEQLKTRGWTEKDIEAKAPAHLLLLYCAELYDEIRDEEMKWTGVPYSQLPVDFVEGQKEYYRRFSEKEIVPLSNIACSYYTIIAGQVRVEQTIAVLRTIEALRLYASNHEGKLPKNMEDIKEVPVPLDPWTNKAISYRLDGDIAVISVKYPPWKQAELPKWATREYHIKIAK